MVLVHSAYVCSLSHLVTSVSLVSLIRTLLPEHFSLQSSFKTFWMFFQRLTHSWSSCNSSHYKHALHYGSNRHVTFNLAFTICSVDCHAGRHICYCFPHTHDTKHFIGQDSRCIRCFDWTMREVLPNFGIIVVFARQYPTIIYKPYLHKYLR